MVSDESAQLICGICLRGRICLTIPTVNGAAPLDALLVCRERTFLNNFNNPGRQHEFSEDHEVIPFTSATLTASSAPSSPTFREETFAQRVSGGMRRIDWKWCSIFWKACFPTHSSRSLVVGHSIVLVLSAPQERSKAAVHQLRWVCVYVCEYHCTETTPCQVCQG